MRGLRTRPDVQMYLSLTPFKYRSIFIPEQKQLPEYPCFSGLRLIATPEYFEIGAI